MKAIKRNELAANTIDGVYVCESGNNVVLYDEDFLESLATVKDGEVVYGNVSDELLARIESEYGIL